MLPKGEAMSEDLTKKLPTNDSEKLTYVVIAVQDLASRLQALDNKVEALDNKVEERLYDTRPIWEQVVTNVAQLQESQQRTEEQSREIRTILRDILRRLSIFNDTLVTMQADYRDIYDRVRSLELRHTGEVC
jgi:seryl-tRNA synthetase